ncbi:MAG TPA: hypothetical protein V6C72_05340, partial [Chroococcales cyanobacterium]
MQDVYLDEKYLELRPSSAIHYIAYVYPLAYTFKTLISPGKNSRSQEFSVTGMTTGRPLEFRRQEPKPLVYRAIVAKRT